MRALRASRRNYHLVGADFNSYHIVYPDVDARYLTPRHTDPSFIPRISSIVKEERIDFLHPQPSSEAYVITSNRRRIGCRVFLPGKRVMELGQDKLGSQQALARKGIPVAKTRSISSVKDVKEAFAELAIDLGPTPGAPLWVRARHGAGGRLSLLCSTHQEAQHWIELWVLRGTPIDEFIIQEYLPGKNIAWDSIWQDGRLVTSYARERLEYPFKHISPSGITGTPSVARIVHDGRVNQVAQAAVRAIDPKPHGAYSIDAKGSAGGEMCVTEVDSGKFHSTMPLWGYIALKHLRMPWYANLADLYVRLGLGEEAPSLVPKTDLIPEGYYLLRDMDVGAFLWREDGWKQKVL